MAFIFKMRFIDSKKFHVLRNFGEKITPYHVQVDFVQTAFSSF
jgi:hypothetical protein